MTERTLYPYPAELDSIPLDWLGGGGGLRGHGEDLPHRAPRRRSDRPRRRSARGHAGRHLHGASSRRAGAPHSQAPRRRPRPSRPDRPPNGPCLGRRPGGSPAPRHRHRERALGGDLHHPCFLPPRADRACVRGRASARPDSGRKPHRLLLGLCRRAAPAARHRPRAVSLSRRLAEPPATSSGSRRCSTKPASYGATGRSPSIRRACERQPASSWSCRCPRSRRW